MATNPVGFMDSLARIDSDGVSFPWDLAVQVLELEYGSGTGMLNTDVASYVESVVRGESFMFDRALGCTDARRDCSCGTMPVSNDAGIATGR